MNYINKLLSLGDGINSFQLNIDKTPALSEFIANSNDHTVLTARQREIGSQLIDLVAPGSGETMAISAAKARVIVFRFSAADAIIIGQDDALIVQLSNGSTLKLMDIDPSSTTILWAQSGTEMPVTAFFPELEQDEDARFCTL